MTLNFCVRKRERHEQRPGRMLKQQLALLGVAFGIRRGIGKLDRAAPSAYHLPKAVRRDKMTELAASRACHCSGYFQM